MRVRLTGGDRGNINRAAPTDGRVLILNDDLVPGFMLRISKRQSTYYVVTRVKGRTGQVRRRLGTTRDTELSQARDAARGIPTVGLCRCFLSPASAVARSRACAGQS